LYVRLKDKGIDVVRFNGETTDALRNEIKLDVDRSVTDPAKSKFQVVLAHYRTGGVGLNMTGITNLVVLDEAWNPASRDQAYGRVDRIGQTEETTVHVIRIKKSIDTWLSQLIEDKEALVAGFEKEMNLAAAMLDALIAGDM
jgi:SNF2 family DNA or RNA helicase